MRTSLRPPIARKARRSPRPRHFPPFHPFRRLHRCSYRPFPQPRRCFPIRPCPPYQPLPWTTSSTSNSKCSCPRSYPRRSNRRTRRIRTQRPPSTQKRDCFACRARYTRHIATSKFVTNDSASNWFVAHARAVRLSPGTSRIRTSSGHRYTLTRPSLHADARR